MPGPHSAAPSGTPANFGFLLVPQYTILTLTSAIAVLRMANRLRGETLYRWRCATLDGAPVASSDGLELIPDGAIDALDAVDTLFVCAGYHPERQGDARLFAALRQLAGRDATLGALCTGTRLLAEAGLLDGYRCAIHWENAESLRSDFPRLRVSSSLFVIDRDRCTCAGGIASIDLMLNLVAEAHGAELMRDISAQFAVERVRTEEDAQRVPLHYLIGAGRQPRLMDAVALMEANIAEPLQLGELAQYVGVSRRQLERLFHVHLGSTPSRYYQHLRLHRGRLLLQQTGAPVAEVAERCGYGSVARFAQVYAARYGRRPRDERRAAP